LTTTDPIRHTLTVARRRSRERPLLCVGRVLAAARAMPGAALKLDDWKTSCCAKVRSLQKNRVSTERSWVRLPPESVHQARLGGRIVRDRTALVGFLNNLTVAGFLRKETELDSVRSVTYRVQDPIVRFS
jgi:hypothetical protein